MGILDGIVEWIAEQIMYGLDLINTSVLGALGCDMSVFLRYFPAANTMYDIFVALAIGLILLLWVWNLFRNFGLGLGSEAEDPVKLSIRSILFIALAWYSDEIVDTVLQIGGTPVQLDPVLRPSQPGFCKFQLRTGCHHRRSRQRRSGTYRIDPDADPGVELPETAV